MHRPLTLLIASAGLSTLGAQTPPPVHLINAPSASSKPVLGTVTAVRQLPNGALLVNDAVKRQLVMFDPSLTNATIVADSTSGGANSYGPGSGSIIPFVADSTLFIDPRDLSMFVIDPAGKIARVAAVPRSQDAGMLGSNTLGSPALDAKGRLVYRGGMTMMRPTFVNGAMSMPEMPDSSALVRVDLATRKIDTAAFYKISKTKMNVVQSEKGISMTNEINPMQVVDDWAVTSDGIIGIVRGQDYHVDWVNADGTTTASPKLPFDWQKLSDDDKVAIIDSAKTAMEKVRSAVSSTGGSSDAAAKALAAGGGGGNGMIVMNSFTMSGGGDGGTVRRPADGGAAGGMPPLQFVNPSELPDYRPAFSAGSARADLEGNLWIRTSSVRAGAVGGPIYDVVNSRGQLTDRIQVPSGRQIIGFGRNGVVYLLARDQNGAWLEQTRRPAPVP